MSLLTTLKGVSTMATSAAPPKASAPPTSKNGRTYSPVLDAMKELQTENGLWHLSDALLAIVPTGTKPFEEIIDKATAEGVVGKLTASTLRQYRDTAFRWPASKRIEKVSFTAHREAQNLGDTDRAAKLLSELAKNLGPSKVTVASVRSAVAAKQGKKPSASTRGQQKPGAQFDALKDLETGGKQLIASITGSTSPQQLDQLHAGLTKVISHVETLRAKAARAKAASKAKASTPAAKASPAKATSKSPATKQKPQGDLRGL